LVKRLWLRVLVALVIWMALLTLMWAIGIIG
jgi:hypothetical protein